MKTIFETLARNENVSARSALRSVKVIYFSMIIGLLSFTAVTFYISDSEFMFKFNINDPVLITALIVLLFVIPIGYLASKALWSKIGTNDSLKDKVIKYQPGFLIRLATCEGAGLLSIVGFLLSNNLVYILLTAITLLLIFYYFPSSEKIGRDINLTQAEIDDLDNKY